MLSRFALMRIDGHWQEDEILRELVKRYGTKKCELLSSSQASVASVAFTAIDFLEANIVG